MQVISFGGAFDWDAAKFFPCLIFPDNCDPVRAFLFGYSPALLFTARVINKQSSNLKANLVIINFFPTFRSKKGFGVWGLGFGVWGLGRPDRQIAA